MVNSSSLLEMKGIRKSFSKNLVLNDVNFYCGSGKIHALVGSNGAGKSTLLKILIGALSSDAGEIYFNGNKKKINNVNDARELGIAMIFQDFNLFPYHKVYENIYIGRELYKRGGILAVSQMKDGASKLLNKMDVQIDIDAYVRNLNLAEQQMVAIAKALLGNAKLLIMDEPTAPLSPKEALHLFSILKDLKNHGVTVILVTHRISEIFQVADVVSIMRDGKIVKTLPISEVDESAIASLMAGRSIDAIFPKRKIAPGRKVFSYSYRDEKIKEPVEFSVNEGETVSLFGLEGQGQRKILRSIFLGSHKEGSVYINDKRIERRNPKILIRNGLVFISDDRVGEGLSFNLSVLQNLITPYVEHRMGAIIKREAKDISESIIQQLNIVLRSPMQKVSMLSGGNQQKVALGKWLSLKPKIMLLDEPTKGIDVNTKSQIYNLIAELADKGMSVLMVSSDIIETIGMSDRIFVVYKGLIVREFVGKESTSEEELLKAAMGILEN